MFKKEHGFAITSVLSGYKVAYDVIKIVHTQSSQSREIRAQQDNVKQNQWWDWVIADNSDKWIFD